MHAPIISSPSRQGAGALQLPSLASFWSGGQTAAMQLPRVSRTPLSGQLASDGGATDADVTGAGAAVADVTGVTGVTGGASPLAAGATDAPAHASGRTDTDSDSASGHLTGTPGASSSSP